MHKSKAYDTAVVLLNYNGRHWLEKFLPVLVKNTPGAHLYVIDNGSTDDSRTFLARHFPDITRIDLDQNYGFAGGYNRGLEKVNEPYAVLLNTDVEVSPGWLEPLRRRLLSEPGIVAVQPKILDYHQKDCFEYAGAAGGFLDFFGYPYCRGRVGEVREKDAGQYDRSYDVHWTSGACMLVRKEDFLSSGGFDEDFFAHQEEIDWCWRMRRAGGRLVYEPESRVWHAGGGSLAYGHPHKTFLNFRNNLRMLLKNLPGVLVFPVIFVRLFLDGVAGLRFLLQGKPAHTWAIVRAHWAFYASIPAYVRKRGGKYLRHYYEHVFFALIPKRKQYTCPAKK